MQQTAESHFLFRSRAGTQSAESTEGSEGFIPTSLLGPDFSSAVHPVGTVGLGRTSSIAASRAPDLWFAVNCAFAVLLELCKAHFRTRWENALQWVDAEILVKDLYLEKRKKERRQQQQHRPGLALCSSGDWMSDKVSASFIMFPLYTKDF